MATNVADLVASLRLDLSGMDKGIAQMQARMGQVEQSVKSAGKSVDGVREPFKKLDDSVVATGKSIYEATHLTRLMSEQLASELSPALGNVLAATTMAARGFQGFSFGITLLGVSVATAIAIIAQLVAGLSEAVKKQVDLNYAVRSFDLSTIRSQSVDAIKELDAFDERIKKSVLGLGYLQNFIIGAFNLVTGNDPVKRSAELIAVLDKLLPLETRLNEARAQMAEVSDRRGLAEQFLGKGEAQDNLKMFDTAARSLRFLIDTEQELGETAAKAAAQIKEMALAARFEDTGPLKRDLNTELQGIKERADAQRMALEARTQAGRAGITSRLRGTEAQPGFEAGSTDITDLIRQSATEAEQPLVDLGRSMETIRRTSDLLGISFDKTGAELTATQKAIIEFNSGVDDADAKLAGLKKRFDDLKNIQEVKSDVHDVFSALGSDIRSAINTMLQGTQTLKQGFADLGRSIAASLIDTGLNRGLKVLEEETMKFIEWLAKMHLLDKILGAAGSVGGAAGGAELSGGAGFADVSPDTAGAIPTFQHGGTMLNTGLAHLEKGETVFPPGMAPGGGSNVVVNIFNQAPETTVDHSETQGGTGERVHNIVIRSLRRAAQTGELDPILAPYGARRSGVGR